MRYGQVINTVRGGGSPRRKAGHGLGKKQMKKIITQFSPPE